MNRKYQRPNFLDEIITQEAYEKWLHRKALTHVKRDRNRGNNSAIVEEYKIAIHNAVIECNGFDSYTNEKLDWTLISTYNNKESKQYGRIYKKKFALLPSVDHVDDGLGSPKFKICSWRTNDAKNDLSLEEFVELCKKVVENSPH